MHTTLQMFPRQTQKEHFKEWITEQNTINYSLCQFYNYISSHEAVASKLKKGGELTVKNNVHNYIICNL